MSAAELLSHLRKLNVKLWKEGDRLRYSAPEGAMTAELRAQLAKYKAEILVFLSQAQTAVHGAAVPLVPVSREGELPLSLAQQRLWLLHQILPDSPFYNISEAVRLEGDLDFWALNRTLDEIIARHEILRTTFPSLDSQPVQVIAPPEYIALPLVDLQNLPEAEREAEARRLARTDAQQSFDLASGPLLRASVLRLGEADHVVLFTLHHIVGDAWSMGILVNEVAALYKAFSQGGASSPLPGLPIQYADYAHWQREWLQGEVLEEQIAYWKKHLAGAPTRLNLPTDRPRPKLQTFRGAHYSFPLPKSLSESLKAFSRQEGVTLFVTLLAAFKTLLLRYTGQEDILIGTPVGNRNRVELEGLIGYFVNTLLLRTNLFGDPSFREALGRVREVALGAFSHQDLPFERVLAELRIRQDPSRISLANVAFALQSAPVSFLELPGLTLHPLRIDETIAKTDLILFISDGSTGLRGVVEYNTDLFDESTIRRLADHFQTLLEAIVSEPEKRLSDLPPSPGQPLVLVKNARSLLDETSDLLEQSNLTRNQYLIWVGQKLKPEIPLFNIANLYTIGGEINPEHFQNAFQTLVNSCDALRTVILDEEGIPQQRVLSTFSYQMEYLDFSDLPEPGSAAREWARKRCQVPFSMEEGLFDAVLIRTAAEEFSWFFKQHHVIADAWSKSLVFKQLAELYVQSLQGRLEEKIELPAFQDYVEYERAYRRSVRYSQAKKYWERKIAAAPEPLAFYGKTPLKQTTNVHRLSCNLGTERTKRLKAIAAQKDFLGRSADAWLFSIFAALICAYLHRLTGSRRLAIGAAFHNRLSKEFRETIGMLMEVRPLYINLEKDDTFASLIKKIAFEAAETLPHRHYAVANPVQKPAYDVFINYQTATFPKFHNAPVNTEWVHSGHENDSFALQIHDYGLSGSFILDFDFHKDVFNETQQEHSVQQFLQVLDAFLDDPSTPLYKVTLLSPEDRRHMLSGLNHKEKDYPEDRTILQFFEERVIRTPHKTAAVYSGGPDGEPGDRRVTFKELSDQADQLANLIRRLQGDS